MPKKEIQRVKKADIDALNIPVGNKSVLIRILQRADKEETKGGILMVGDTDWEPAVHSTRMGEVVKVPRDPLPFKFHHDLMPWKTCVEIMRGMMVWFDYMAWLNGIGYVDEYDTEYSLINYEDCYVATFPQKLTADMDLVWLLSTETDDYIIPLNGFHLFERIYEEEGWGDYKKKKLNTKEAIVRYVAVNNKAYENNSDEDHVDLQVGDKVMFGPVPEVTLEDPYHCHFDGGKMYRRAQARNIDLVWRNGEIIIPKGRVLIEQIPEDMTTASGITLLKKRVKSHRGKVVQSQIEEANEGDVVLYIPGAGMLITHEGRELRILKESEVQYVV